MANRKTGISIVMRRTLSCVAPALMPDVTPCFPQRSDKALHWVVAITIARQGLRQAAPAIRSVDPQLVTRHLGVRCLGLWRLQGVMCADLVVHERRVGNATPQLEPAARLATPAKKP